MAAISNLILTFLIIACALYIQLICLIENHQEMQEKQDSQLSTLVQEMKETHTLQLSIMEQNHQELLGKLHNKLDNITKMLQSRLPTPTDCSTAPAIGSYNISPKNKALGSFDVYCDMDPRSWIVFQRRFDGSLNFDRNWIEYDDGFGSLAGEFWLGLKKLHILTSHNKWELRMDLEDFEGNHAYALYDDFKVGDSSSLYRLTLGSYSGTAGDSMVDFNADSLNGMAFTTKDKDNDKWLDHNCGAYQGSGWWHRHCSMANLNGYRYLGQDGDNKNCMFWFKWKEWESLKKSDMKIRQVD